MSRTPTAHAPVRDLLVSLKRAGWGDLAGREWHGVRAVLDGVLASLPHGSGQGHLTEPQVAQRSGYSLRWTRRCMHLLEDLGVIETWHRGGVVAGQPTPSWVRLSKRFLVALIEAARPAREAIDAARRSRTLARIAGLRYVKRSRRSDHAALSADLPTPPGETPGVSPPDEASPAHAGECDHGLHADRLPDGRPRCPICRHEAAA